MNFIMTSYRLSSYHKFNGICINKFIHNHIKVKPVIRRHPNIPKCPHMTRCPFNTCTPFWDNGLRSQAPYHYLKMGLVIENNIYLVLATGCPPIGVSLYITWSKRVSLSTQMCFSLRNIVELWCESKLLPDLVVVMYRLHGLVYVPC